MHIIQHTSSGSNPIKIPINTEFNNITFNQSNYNNVNAKLINPLQLKDAKHNFMVSISSFQIPISWPTISSYLNNNLFQYVLNSVTYSYTIPDGSYSANDLKSLFNSNILLSVSYSKITGKFTFTHSTYNFQISNNSTCYYLIGFENVTYTSSALSLSSVRPIDLSGTRSIYIRSNLSTSNIDRNGQESNIIDIIPIDVNNFDILRYRNLDGFRTIIKNQNIDEIMIILEDDRGNKIDINNNWEIVMEFNTIVNDNIPDPDVTNIKPIEDESNDFTL